ncbi:hypothetical protein N7481_009241 [Penicillium waksmanii]|uniref:uncharacterized protein n=1 Tax=Penicillium waksmanii TaxID=69791 RepID=UPI002548DAA0|nr:uncharacterized protein N7481_009241 [Penicillium waksmanii]KAJ5975534.1 hypothetical protein N7481_009241 [Penicillium waksmanii]
MTGTTTLAEFYVEYPKVRDAVIDHAAFYDLPETQKAWFKLNLERNPVGGKCNRGMTVLDSV